MGIGPPGFGVFSHPFPRPVGVAFVRQVSREAMGNLRPVEKYPLGHAQ
jgi:hypothetical protein